MEGPSTDPFLRIEELLDEVEQLGGFVRVHCYYCLRELRRRRDFFRDEAARIICCDCSERLALNRQERTARRAEAIRRLPPA